MQTPGYRVIPFRQGSGKYHGSKNIYCPAPVQPILCGGSIPRMLVPHQDLITTRYQLFNIAYCSIILSQRLSGTPQCKLPLLHHRTNHNGHPS